MSSYSHHMNISDPQFLDIFFCRHCNEIIKLDDVKHHSCFEGREVFLEGEKELYSSAVNEVPLCSDNSSENILTTMTSIDDNKKNEIQDSNCETKQPSTLKNKEAAAVWTNNAILALLTLYEANIGMLDHPKKKTKIWDAIAHGLRDFNIEMSSQQIRWKMNATKRYKECVDNNNKTGRGTVEFQWFDQLNEIFGNKNNVEPTYTVSSKLKTSKNKASYVTATNEQSEDGGMKKKKLRESHFKMKNIQHTVVEEMCPLSDIAANKQVIEGVTSTMKAETLHELQKKRPTHGTGSNIAKTKIELGKQWHQHLQDKAKKEVIKEKRYEDMMKKKEELLTLKKKQIELREKEIQQRKVIASNKLKDKERRHAEILSLERKKCKLLRAHLKKDTGNTSPKYISDSSD